MRILVVTNLYPPHYIGGYELICQTVVEALRARGHTVAILASDHVVEAARRLSGDPGVERVLKINGLYGHPWHRIHRLQKLEAQNNDLLRASLRRHSPDLVYVWNMGGLSKSMLFTLEQFATPIVYYLSDHWLARGPSADVWLAWWNRANAPWPQRLARQWWNLTGAHRRWSSLAPTRPLQQLRLARIYFCSRALHELTMAAGFKVAHGAVIPCPVNARFFKGLPPPPRLRMERLLYAGRLASDKGVLTALQALVLLKGVVHVGLDVYGHGTSEYETMLKDFVRERQLPVRFAAADSGQMPDIYREHDLLLFPSEWAEPFALTPIEAMACGLPVIGTTTGGSAELFRHGENALVFKAGDASDLAAQIRQFGSDYGLRTRCASTAYHEARQHYAAPVVVDQIENYLAETLTVGKQGGPACLSSPAPCAS
jgi:glycosyltransferase involved in cell wall biosynthesis